MTSALLAIDPMQPPAFKLFAQQYLAALLEESGQVYINPLIPRDPSLRTYKYPSLTNLGTTLLSRIVGTSKQIRISPEVIGEAELVDVLFEPNESPDRPALGCLSQFTHAPTLIQILRHAPDSWEMKACLRHWLCWRAEASNAISPVSAPTGSREEPNEDWETPAAEASPEADLVQQMVILVPSIAVELLRGFGLQPAPDDLRGIYRFPPAFKITVVVISQLPAQPSTLLLRVLGRGPGQRQAI